MTSRWGKFLYVGKIHGFPRKVREGNIAKAICGEWANVLELAQPPFHNREALCKRCIRGIEALSRNKP